MFEFKTHNQIQNMGYMQKIPDVEKYPYTIIVLVPLHYDSELKSIAPDYRYSKTLENADMKAVKLKIEYEYTDDAEVLIIPSVNFNEMVFTYKSNATNEYKLSTVASLINNKGNNMTLALTDQNAETAKYIVYNLTDRKFIQATETADQALSIAENHSRTNPTKKFMVAAPSKLVFQPINVVVEEINLTA